MRYKLTAHLSAACGITLAMFAASADARLMTVADLQGLIEKGPAGKAAAAAHVSGITAGLFGMDSMLQKEQGTSPAFCGAQELRDSGGSIPNPAKNTEQLVEAWEQQGVKSMSTPAVDMVVAYLTAKYGC